jgi:hypothetical protein
MNELLEQVKQFPSLQVQGNVLLAAYELGEMEPAEVLQAVINLAYNCYMLGVADERKAVEKRIAEQIDRDNQAIDVAAAAAAAVTIQG